MSPIRLLSSQVLNLYYKYHSRFHLYCEDFCLPLSIPELIITEELQSLILPNIQQ